MPRAITNRELPRIIPLLRQAAARAHAPLVDAMAVKEDTPYKILIATLISLRTKDTLTEVAAPRLFALADTPEKMLGLTEEEIARAIYPAGFYRRKARDILVLSRLLIERHGGRVPDDLDELLALPGVGRKTANLVLTAGYGRPGICVDTHVHRITNRWGYVRTTTPLETEMALRRKLPGAHWIEWNGLLVSFGQNTCHPTSPWCSRCPLAELCPRRGVARSR